MITVLNQPLIKEFPGFIYEQGRPSWLKSTSANSEFREFLLRGAQNVPWLSGRGKNNNQCPGTVALARRVPLFMNYEPQLSAYLKQHNSKGFGQQSMVIMAIVYY